MRKFVLIPMLLGAVALAQAASAENMPAPVNQSDIKWGPAPPIVQPGAKLAVISGDMTKPGPFVFRLQLPPNYKIAAHHHSNTEYVTIIAGTFHLGMGDKLDESKGLALKAGGFAEAPAKMNHYGWTGNEPAEVQIQSTGPFDLIYVNPADDPSKKQ